MSLVSIGVVQNGVGFFATPMSDYATLEHAGKCKFVYGVNQMFITIACVQKQKNIFKVFAIQKTRPCLALPFEQLQ